MKNKNIFSTILLLSVLFFCCEIAYGQRDSVAIESIYSKSKPMQFGNDYVDDYMYILSQDIPNNNHVPLYSIDYRQRYLVYDPIRDPKRLLFNTGLFVGAAVASFGILWISPESFSGWDKDEIREDGLFKKWNENVRAGPVWDEDDWFLNWVTHPWAGAVYYMSARGSGFKRWESFIYSTIMSTFFWEYGVEAFAEIPSWQDLMITPIVGSAIGEGFFILKGKIIRNDRRVLNSRGLGIASMILMDPFNELLNGLGYKTKNKMQTYSTLAPIDYDYASNKPIWGLQVTLQF